MILLKQMMIFFLIISIGFFCGKKRYFDDEGMRVISFIVVNIANPAMIIGAGLEKSSLSYRQIVITFLFVIAFYAVLILLASFLSQSLYKAMLVFSNIGFMGMPILSATYGPESLIYASLFLFVYNILIYTYGVRMIQQKKAERTKSYLKIVNMGTVACTISLTVFLLNISVPAFLQSAIKSLGNLTAPLSMMVIGYSLSKICLKDLFLDKMLFIFSVIKQFIIPLAGIFLIQNLISDKLLIQVFFIILATPVGSMVAMFAQGSDTESLAAKGVALTTILSIISIPLLSQLFSV